MTASYLVSRVPRFFGERDILVLLCVLSRPAERQIPQLVAVVENVIANSGINEPGEKNAYPNGEVVGVDSQGVPVITDPTPELGT